jgi:hypothetical protein
MGRYAEVLAAVEALRPQLEALPLAGEAEEGVEPWNVRESLLNTGGYAAMHSGRWEVALALTAESIKAKRARGATALEVARTRYTPTAPC